jgi:hypothetical protein
MIAPSAIPAWGLNRIGYAKIEFDPTKDITHDGTTFLARLRIAKEGFNIAKRPTKLEMFAFATSAFPEGDRSLDAVLATEKLWIAETADADVISPGPIVLALPAQPGDVADCVIVATWED